MTASILHPSITIRLRRLPDNFWHRVFVCQARHFVCSKQDIPCVPSVPCVPSKTFLVFQARHSLCSKHYISCVPSKTSPVLRSRKMYTPLFDEFGQSTQDSCESLTRTPLILGRSTEVAKKWRVNGENFKRPKNCEDNSDFEDFWTESIASAQTFFSPNFRADEKLFARTNKFSRRRKNFATHERSNEPGARNCQVNAVVES